MTDVAPSRIGLEYLSVFGMPLREYVALASHLDCDFISVNFGRTANASHPASGETLRESAALRATLAEALADHRMRLELVEGFALRRDIAAEDYAADLDAVARLGARSICAVSLDKDMARTHAQFASLARMAAERGLVVTTEVGAGVLRDFETASDAWRIVAHPAFALLIDTMHFFRSGASVSDLDALPAQAIGHVQLCDVPMPAHKESYMEEALFERRVPGDGDLPLAAFLARIPRSVPVGLEIPLRSQAQAGIAAETRLRRCIAQTRALMPPTLG